MSKLLRVLDKEILRDIGFRFFFCNENICRWGLFIEIDLI